MTNQTPKQSLKMTGKMRATLLRTRPSACEPTEPERHHELSAFAKRASICVQESVVVHELTTVGVNEHASTVGVHQHAGVNEHASTVGANQHDGVHQHAGVNEHPSTVGANQHDDVNEHPSIVGANQHDDSLMFDQDS